MAELNNSLKTTFKVDDTFLFIGQSNVVGVDTGGTKEGVLQSSGVDLAYEWDYANLKWIVADDPLTHITEQIGNSFIRTFCKQYSAANPGRTIGIIPAARSGSALGGGDWLKNGTYYEAARARATTALLKTHNFKGFIWMQGESDANASFAASYQTNLQSMISDMRNDIGAGPFVAAKLPDFAVTAYAPYGVTVNTAIENCNASDYAFISTDGLTNIDGSHFDTASQKIIGASFYTAYAGLI